MRTLATQLRLRRLVQAHAGFVRRLREDTLDRSPVAAGAVHRLLELVEGVRRSWQQECALAMALGSEAAGPAAGRVRRHLAALRAGAAALEIADLSLDQLEGEFRAEAASLTAFLEDLDRFAAVRRPLPAERLSA